RGWAPWWWAGCWSAWARATVRAARAATAFAACRGCRRARWSPPAPSWRPASSPSIWRVIFSARSVSHAFALRACPLCLFPPPALFAFAAGLLFGLGLIVSGMSDPGKVIGFLDLAGNWDPSLAFVMAGAVAVGFLAFRFAGRRGRSLLGGALHLPTRRDIDRR